MLSTLVRMIDRLDAGRVPGEAILERSCPVPFFGDALTARVATVGLNPSDLEFVDRTGHILVDGQRRLHTLDSLGVGKWGQVGSVELTAILAACREYFRRNPYVSWFGALERILSIGGATYFGDRPTACHLDIVPYATRAKWSLLPHHVRTSLVANTVDVLGRIVRDSGIRVVVLNGRSVVTHFERLIGSKLTKNEVLDWALPRGSGHSVRGVAYQGSTSTIGGVRLDAPLSVVGYNHNLQSSFGMTRLVTNSIGNWVGHAVGEAIR